MTLAAGSRLGPYGILAPLGAGGMGEVYKAKDTRLDRTVAIKVLPAHLSQNADVRQRFEREARTISSLSHPHICALYDVGHQDGTDYLVMEYLEGETLTERLAKGSLPTEQVLRYGIEMADALDKAHRQGVIHRDLKPGNVMLTKSGVKLLDFGLAKVVQPAVPKSSLTALPTAAENLTQEGTVLGTFQYMAPEQLEGKEADARTDIFAFGAVLYEMATGKKAFESKSQASLIAAILTADPAPVSTIQPMAPPALDRVVKTCLAKDPEDRWQSAHDIGSELAWIAQGGSQAGVAAPVVASRRRRDRLTWGVVGALAGAAAAALATWALLRGESSAGRPVTHVAIALPPSETLVVDNFSSIAISTDGRQIVYVARKGDVRQLFRRSLDAAEATPIAGTEGAFTPFFSPDGRWVGFWADGKVKKVSLAGGMPVPVCSLAEPLLGGTWGPDDAILYPEKWAGGLLRMPASGGSGAPLTKPALKGEDRGHLWPEILPDGKAVLFTVFTGGNLDDYAIAVRSLTTGEQKVLIRGGTFGRYAATGHIIYARGGALFAVPFDAKRLVVTGAPYPIAQGVALNTNGGAAFAASRDGTLLYVLGGFQQQNRALYWVDRKGTASPISRTRRAYNSPSLSPNGKRLVVVVEAQTYDIWVLDVERDSLARFSFGKDDGDPIWSPDGKRIVFNSSQAGPSNLYAKASDGSGSEQRLTADQDSSDPTSWSPDGKLLAYERTRNGVPEIWLHSFEKGSQPRPFLQSAYRHQSARFSPDGHWMAYSSDESGRFEVYVTTFPGPGGRWQVSSEGGDHPLWAPNGREIFYRKDKKVMRAAVATSPAFSASRPEMLFEGQYEDAWDIARDGRRFVMIKDEGAESAPKHMNLVLGWFEELKRLVRAEDTR